MTFWFIPGEGLGFGVTSGVDAKTCRLCAGSMLVTPVIVNTLKGPDMS